MYVSKCTQVFSKLSVSLNACFPLLVEFCPQILYKQEYVLFIYNFSRRIYSVELFRLVSQLTAILRHLPFLEVF